MDSTKKIAALGETVIFEIDNDKDGHPALNPSLVGLDALDIDAKFLRHMSTARAMGNMTGSFTPCIGSWGGIMSTAYMVNRRDYDKLVKDFYTLAQDCVLVVPADTRQPAYLEKPDGTHESVGPMVELFGSVEKSMVDGWTYIPSTYRTFSCGEKANEVVRDRIREDEMEGV